MTPRAAATLACARGAFRLHPLRSTPSALNRKFTPRGKGACATEHHCAMEASGAGGTRVALKRCLSPTGRAGLRQRAASLPKTSCCRRCRTRCGCKRCVLTMRTFRSFRAPVTAACAQWRRRPLHAPCGGPPTARLVTARSTQVLHASPAVNGTAASPGDSGSPEAEAAEPEAAAAEPAEAAADGEADAASAPAAVAAAAETAAAAEPTTAQPAGAATAEQPDDAGVGRPGQHLLKHAVSPEVRAAAVAEFGEEQVAAGTAICRLRCGKDPAAVLRSCGSCGRCAGSPERCGRASPAPAAVATCRARAAACGGLCVGPPVHCAPAQAA